MIFNLVFTLSNFSTLFFLSFAYILFYLSWLNRLMDLLNNIAVIVFFSPEYV